MCVFHVTASFPDTVSNGCEAMLLPLLRHFSALGVDVSVYCPWPRAETKPFPGVTVRSLLPDDGTYPPGFQQAPFHLTNLISAMRRAVGECDLVYVHGSGLPLNVGRFVADCGKPLVTSVHDLAYPLSTLSALDLVGRVISVSAYQGDCLKELLGRLYTNPDELMSVIPCGVHTSDRRRSPMLSALGLSPGVVPVLYPHRMDLAKGIFDTLEALALLKDKVPEDVHRQIRLLVPRSGPTDQGSAYQQVRRRAAELGVDRLIHFHRRIPIDRMSDYYAVGVATMCIGTFVEAFANVHIESTAAGTPAIVSRVGTYRRSLPECQIRRVDPGDTEAAAAHLADLVVRPEPTSAEVRSYIEQAYNVPKMVAGYERAILERPGHAVQAAAQRHGLTSTARLRLPPWCALLGRGFYNDYTGYVHDDDLAGCLPMLARGATVGELITSEKAGMADIQRWYGQGHLAYEAASPEARRRPSP